MAPLSLTINQSGSATILRGRGEPGAELQALVDNTVVSTTTIGANGTWTLTFTLDRPEAHTIAVQIVATDILSDTTVYATTGQAFNVYLALVMGSSPLQGTVKRDANLRAGPGLTFRTVGVVRVGESVTLVACSQACLWYRLASGEWIAAFLVQPTADPHRTLPLETLTASGE
jgi:hypothetical protein